MVNLFVYGTLKKGHRNHRVLGPDARFVGTGTVLNMVMHKGPGFPYAVFKDGSSIRGEVYELPNLDQCDRLEGYPHHYERWEVMTHLDDNSAAFAWVYTAGPTVNLGWYPETTTEWTEHD